MVGPYGKVTWLLSRALLEDYASSHSLPAPAGESSVDTSLAGALYAPSNGTPTVRPFWRKDKTMESWPPSLFGLTWRRSTGNLGEDVLTWFLAGFRARTSAAPERETVSTEPKAGFGVRWRESSVKFDRNTFLWKTHRCLFTEDLPESSVTLPRWGSMRDGVVYQRLTSERPISVTGSGYLATPTSTGNQLCPSMQKSPSCKAWLPTPRNNTGPSKDKRHLSLDGYAKMFPTPSASSYGTNQGGAAGRVVPVRLSLETMARKNQWPTPCKRDYRTGDQLNPGFVEWIMGWGYDYTKINTRWIPFSREEITEECLRTVWFDKEFASSPQGRKFREQFSGKYRNTVRYLSHETSLENREAAMEEIRSFLPNMWEACNSWPMRDSQKSFQEAWKSSSRETKSWIAMASIRGIWHSEWPGVQRICEKLINRVDRIRALGNGQVPRVAAAAWRILNET